MLKKAGQIALSTIPDDPRNFLIGCVGVRDDGTIVSAKNGAVFSTTVDNYQLLPGAHAEGRVLRKVGKGGTMYVTRIAKANGAWAMARPCGMCQVRIRSADIVRVYYTINPTQYGVWFPDADTDVVYDV